MVREPVSPDRMPVAAPLQGRMNISLFTSFFIGEVALREHHGRAVISGPLPLIEKRYEKMLTTAALRIKDCADQWDVSPVNLSFIFLNRYYGFALKSVRLTNIAFFWEDFLVEISHDAVLIGLLNYDDVRRKLVCDTIREMVEASRSQALKSFVVDYCGGYKVGFPQHFNERSRMFETVLVMLSQLESEGLVWFLNQHAIEILKAHLFSLKRFGNPIKLHLGHFIGEVAMRRLRDYHGWWQRRRAAGRVKEIVL